LSFICVCIAQGNAPASPLGSRDIVIRRPFQELSTIFRIQKQIHGRNIVECDLHMEWELHSSIDTQSHPETREADEIGEFTKAADIVIEDAHLSHFRTKTEGEQQTAR
jgi:hypothetical protein